MACASRAEFDTEFDCTPLLTGGPIPMVFSPGGLESGQGPARFAGALHGSRAAPGAVSDLHESDLLDHRWLRGGWYTALWANPTGQGSRLRGQRATPCASSERGRSRVGNARTTHGRANCCPTSTSSACASQLWRNSTRSTAVAVEGSMMGGFDPMSPAVHVWGSVMILPYSGLEDSQAALEAIQEDLGPGQLQVVVVDLTGAEVDTVEGRGLLQLIDSLTACGLETVVVGMSDAAAESY